MGNSERDGRNLDAGQEAIVRTGHGTTDWFQIEKGIRQVCILTHSWEPIIMVVME